MRVIRCLWLPAPLATSFPCLLLLPHLHPPTSHFLRLTPSPPSSSRPRLFLLLHPNEKSLAVCGFSSSYVMFCSGGHRGRSLGCPWSISCFFYWLIHLAIHLFSSLFINRPSTFLYLLLFVKLLFFRGCRQEVSIIMIIIVITAIIDAIILILW